MLKRRRNQNFNGADDITLSSSCVVGVSSE
jgi:hypothetical protein